MNNITEQDLLKIAIGDLCMLSVKLENYHDITKTMAFDTALHFVNMAMQELEVIYNGKLEKLCMECKYHYNSFSQEPCNICRMTGMEKKYWEPARMKPEPDYSFNQSIVDALKDGKKLYGLITQ